MLLAHLEYLHIHQRTTWCCIGLQSPVFSSFLHSGCHILFILPYFNSIIHLESNKTTLLWYYVDQLKRRSLTLRMMGIGYCDTLQIEKIELVVTVAIISAGEL